MMEHFHNPVINPLHHKKNMTITTLDKAIAAVPKFKDRLSLFTKKLRLAQYADGSIYDYRLKIAQSMLSIFIIIAPWKTCTSRHLSP